MRHLSISFALLTLVISAAAASKPHVLSLGKPTPVKLLLGPSEEKTVTITVRPLYLDTKLKEYTTGPAHDITDRVFVIRRAYRVNDSLPNESAARWLWQRGGWLLVDRTTGRITQIRLPDFDPYYSDVSWYRDYAAYCGVADDGERVSAIVAQITAKKPIYKKQLDKLDGELPDAVCQAPLWQRNPIRVTFTPLGGEKLSVDVTGRFADVTPDTPAEE
ncbi:MAG TPA: hypothetical protein VMU45_03865 [Candidatus Eisenbacteria bacterium]|nr:hypothetical protein [Candidatus Eisenbacteria bacterium]